MKLKKGLEDESQKPYIGFYGSEKKENIYHNTLLKQISQTCISIFGFHCESWFSCPNEERGHGIIRNVSGKHTWLIFLMLYVQTYA